MQIFLWGQVFSFPSPYAQLLEKYVNSEGFVRYSSWKEDPLHTQLTHELQTYSPTGDDTSYWINAYNALTIQVIIEHYPIKSIKDISEGKVWNTRTFSLSGGIYTLDQIEHEILRPRKDPRIHAALNCASIGCPPLWNKPYSQKQLSIQLDDAMHRWYKKNAYTQTANGIFLSKIFLWYAEDFTPSPIQYLNNYFPQTSWPTPQNIQYMEYDWSLNKQ